ncbi:recombinase RecT [Acidovorax sp. LjRoot66]|uniref:recombinase RecT n=1 Tax=Acidovorax sp. LjRoot66 TaxID=3342334 RepID=UPI003ECF6187
MSAITPQENTALTAPRGMGFDLSPQTFEQAMKFSHMLAESDLVPKDFKGKPGNCLIAMQWGSELGLKPLQALSNIAVVNGRAALWGDAVIALVRSSPLCEYVQESDDGHTATCRAKRRGEPEQVVTFSMDDAKQAGLSGKQGPWTQYPKRMRQMRARAFALRDVFPDVLRGMPVAEEVQDMPTERHMGEVERVDPARTQGPAAFPVERFTKNLPEWRKAIALGKATADSVIGKALTIGTLTPEQEEAVRAPLTDAEKAPAAKPAAAQPVGQQVTDVQPKGEAPAADRQKFTFAQVSEFLHSATDLAALGVAAELIGAVDDPQHRAELVALFEERQFAFEAE